MGILERKLFLQSERLGSRTCTPLPDRYDDCRKPEVGVWKWLFQVVSSTETALLVQGHWAV